MNRLTRLELLKEEIEKAVKDGSTSMEVLPDYISCYGIGLTFEKKGECILCIEEDRKPLEGLVKELKKLFKIKNVRIEKTPELTEGSKKVKYKRNLLFDASIKNVPEIIDFIVIKYYEYKESYDFDTIKYPLKGPK